MLINEATAFPGQGFCTEKQVFETCFLTRRNGACAPCRVHVAQRETRPFPRENGCLARFSTMFSVSPGPVSDDFLDHDTARFLVCGDGCSQRYPHPGYAQNLSAEDRNEGAQPVDRNGDSDRFLIRRSKVSADKLANDDRRITALRRPNERRN